MSVFGTFFSMRNPMIMAEFVSRVIPGMGGAMQDAGDEIVQLAKSEVQSRLFPGHGYLTGALHDSYDGNATPVGTTIVDIKFGSELYYAPIVEFSWGGRVAHFFPSMAEVERQAPDIIRKHVDGVFHL